MRFYRGRYGTSHKIAMITATGSSVIACATASIILGYQRVIISRISGLTDTEKPHATVTQGRSSVCARDGNEAVRGLHCWGIPDA